MWFKLAVFKDLQTLFIMLTFYTYVIAANLQKNLNPTHSGHPDFLALKRVISYGVLGPNLEAKLSYI